MHPNAADCTRFGHAVGGIATLTSSGTAHAQTTGDVGASTSAISWPITYSGASK